MVRTIFATETAALQKGTASARWDAVAIATTFKAVLLEGLEVVFIVIAIGAVGSNLIPAAIGAAIAGAVVIMLGLALHRPLSRVPENALKFTVGVLLSAFGIFWVGEGLGFRWPGDDMAIPGMILLLAAVALALARAVRPDRTLAPGRRSA